MLSHLNQLQSRRRPPLARGRAACAPQPHASRVRVPVRSTPALRLPPPPPCPGPRRAPSTHQVKSLPFILRSRPATLPAAPCASGGGAPGPASEAASIGSLRSAKPGTPRSTGAGKTGGGACEASRGSALPCARARAPALSRSPSCPGGLLRQIINRQTTRARQHICRLQPGTSRGAGGERALFFLALAVEPRCWVTPNMHFRFLWLLIKISRRGDRRVCHQVLT